MEENTSYEDREAQEPTVRKEFVAERTPQGVDVNVHEIYPNGGGRLREYDAMEHNVDQRELSDELKQMPVGTRKKSSTLRSLFRTFKEPKVDEKIKTILEHENKTESDLESNLYQVTGNDQHGYVAEVAARNQHGVHARPAALLAKAASKYDCEVLYQKGDNIVSGKSIMGLMTLEMSRGVKVKVTTTNDDGCNDAEQCIDEIVEMFENKFDED